MNFSVIELFALAMFFIGFYGLITSKNVIKSIVFISVVEMAVIIFWVGLGFRAGMVPPIGEFLEHDMAYIADPLPQALMITAIIIGMSVTAANIVMLITLVRKVKSTDWDTIKSSSENAT
ncbi:MAG: sodium:proton antiporter [Defluviitaleaceae bacterium]|nr:sodium:proton antiporter [Defluviitaleaceae bacterium]